jgi:hypothetical protein
MHYAQNPVATCMGSCRLGRRNAVRFCGGLSLGTPIVTTVSSADLIRLLRAVRFWSNLPLTGTVTNNRFSPLTRWEWGEQDAIPAWRLVGMNPVELLRMINGKVVLTRWNGERDRQTLGQERESAEAIRFNSLTLTTEEVGCQRASSTASSSGGRSHLVQ